ncbi:MAG: hypothetical protein AAF388_29210 [Bacteroidota bacterium]
MGTDTPGKEIENKPSEQPASDAQVKESRLRRYWKSIEPTIRVILFASLLMLFFFAAYRFHNWSTEVNTMKFLQPYLKTDEIIQTRINSLKNDRVMSDEDKISTLKVQYKILTERKKHHRDLAGFFVSNYYASILIVLFASISGGIIIFVIANKGWARTNPYIKAVFFVLSFMAVFFAIFPNVFGQRGNFENNLEAFIRYDNLQLEIFNYMSTSQKNELENNAISLDSMITYVNKRIIELNQIYISNAETRLTKAQEMINTFNGIESTEGAAPSFEELNTDL